MNPILIVVIAAALLGVWGYTGKSRRNCADSQPSCPPQPCHQAEPEKEPDCQAPPHCSHQPNCCSESEPCCSAAEGEEYEVQLNCQADPDYEMVWECGGKDFCGKEEDCADLNEFCDDKWDNQANGQNP